MARKLFNIIDKEINIQILKHSENQGGLGGISVNKALSCKHGEQCLTPRIHIVKKTTMEAHIHTPSVGEEWTHTSFYSLANELSTQL